MKFFLINRKDHQQKTHIYQGIEYINVVSLRNKIYSIDAFLCTNSLGGAWYRRILVSEI